MVQRIVVAYVRVPYRTFRTKRVPDGTGIWCAFRTARVLRLGLSPTHKHTDIQYLSVKKLSRLPAFPGGEGAPRRYSQYFTLCTRHLGFKTLKQCVQCTRYPGTVRVRVRNTPRLRKIDVFDYYGTAYMVMSALDMCSTDCTQQ